MGTFWVEWDEPGCCDKQNREQQTEWGNLIKRPFIRVPEIGNGNSFPYSISNLCLEQLVNVLLKPQLVNHAGTLAALQQQSAANGDLIADMKTMQAKLNQKNPGVFSEGISLPNQTLPSHLWINLLQ
ncbi:auxin response factor 5 isoform X1 [Prunus yedoensis var. nudiflora]|uniref:Auxin response factor 5 isoform X1 n=1 Tax=Prunus yedoensis var. nudiflora TaxID=2094558 RepID=A0A314YPW9_PRUYE|nr:auxin response factor 5 isoform X1 [Prunus yedoensis var. nudiflora]